MDNGAFVSHMNTPVRDTPRRRCDGDRNGRPRCCFGPKEGSPGGIRSTEDGPVVAAGRIEAEYWEGGLNACTLYRLAAAGLIERLIRVLTVGFADGYDAADTLGPQHRRLVKTRTWGHGRETAPGHNGR